MKTAKMATTIAVLLCIVITLASCSSSIRVKRLLNPSKTTAAEIHWDAGSAVNDECFYIYVSNVEDPKDFKMVYRRFYVECDAAWLSDTELLITVYETDRKEGEEKVYSYGDIAIKYNYQPQKVPPLYDYDQLLDLIRKGQTTVAE